MKILSSKVILNTNLLAVLMAGFASGLPLALTGATLQAWLTEANVNLLKIGALSFLGLPYIWKFLWSPLFDKYTVLLKDKRKGWMLLTQLLLAACLFAVAQFDPKHSLQIILLFMVCIAFLSASQDIVIDAYRTNILPVQTRGVGAAYFIFAYRMAMLVSGGVALLLADHYGWQATYKIMAGLMLLCVLATLLSPNVKTNPVTESAVFKQAFKSLLQHKAIALIMFFIVFYKLGDALALSLLTNFLLHGLGFSLSQIGLAMKSVSLVATILGAFIAGLCLVRLGLYRGLLYFGLAQAFSNLTFLGLALVGKSYSLMVSVIFIENFCSGMGTAAFMAFFMSLCAEKYTATQYAYLSALAAIGRVLLGPFAAIIVMKVGWVNFFGCAFLLSLPGMAALILLKKRVNFNVA